MEKDGHDDHEHSIASSKATSSTEGFINKLYLNCSIQTGFTQFERASRFSLVPDIVWSLLHVCLRILIITQYD